MRVTSAIVLAAALGGCSGESWTAFVYPDRHDVRRHVEVGRFEKLEDCRAASLAALARLSAGDQGFYVCGSRCTERAGVSGPFMCEHTER